MDQYIFTQIAFSLYSESMSDREKAVEIALRAALPRGAVSIEASEHDDADAIAILPDGSRQRIEFVWAGHGFPRDVERALHTHENARRDDTTLVLGAESMSVGARELLSGSGTSWVALDGAASIHLGTVWVERERRGPVARPQPSAAWTAARADVAEVALTHVARGARWPDGSQRMIDVETLAAQSGRSYGTVANALAQFDASGWTAPGPEPRSRSVVDGGGMLDSWAEWEANHRGRWDSLHTLSREPDENIGLLLHEFGDDVVLTGSAVSERSHPTLTGPRVVSAYVESERGWHELQRRAAAAMLLPSDTGLIRLAPAPTQVLGCATIVDGIRTASPIRVYADMLRGTDREREVAEDFRRRELGLLT